MERIGDIAQLDHLGHVKKIFTCATHVNGTVLIKKGPPCLRTAIDYAAVPPTVRASMRKVGWPTPTGTLWPFLPQVPMPVSSFISLPIIETRVIASGPLPIKVAPLMGAASLPFSMR